MFELGIDLVLTAVYICDTVLGYAADSEKHDVSILSGFQVVIVTHGNGDSSTLRNVLPTNRA